MAACTHQIGTADTGVLPNTSGAFVPALNDLLVVFVIQSATAGAAPTLTSSVGLTFTLAASRLGANSIYCFIADALVSDTSSQTVTTDDDPTDPATGSIIFVESVSGMSKVGQQALLQSKPGVNTAGTTPAIVFDASCLTGNPTLACVSNTSSPAGLTPPTNWTEPASTGDLGYSTPTTGGEVVFRDSGFTGTTITWGATSATGWVALGVELDASSTTGGVFLSSTTQLFAGTIVPGAVAITGALLASGVQLFAGTVAHGAVTVNGTTIASGAQLFAGTVTPGAVAVGGATIASGAQLFTGTVAPGAVTVLGVHRASTTQLFAGTLSQGGGVQEVAGVHVSTGAQLFAGTTTAGSVAVAGVHVASGAQMFAGTTTAGPVAVGGAFLAAGSQVFSGTVGVGAVTVGGASIPSGAVLFAGTVSLGGEIVGETIPSGSALFAGSVALVSVPVVTPSTGSWGDGFQRYPFRIIHARAHVRGVSARVTVGTVEARGGARVTVSGVEAVGQVGDVMALAHAAVTVRTISAEALVGTVSANVGSAQAICRYLTHPAITTTVAWPVVTGSATVEVSGVASVTELGTVCPPARVVRRSRPRRIDRQAAAAMMRADDQWLIHEEAA